MIFDTNYWFWPGILPDELCDTIINEGDKLVSYDGQIGNDDHKGSAYDPYIRDTNISFFEEDHWVQGICTHFVTIANRNSGWNFDIRNSQNVQYARYFPDQHYIPHRDDIIRTTGNNSSGMMRKLTVVIQVTDPSMYEGGNFVIEKSDDSGQLEELTNFRQRGSIIVFPSILQHGVMPITSGVRHSIVCWVIGPNFR